MTVGNEIAYYLRPVNGSDSNDGKSFGGAWKTWQKVINEMCVTGGSGVTTDSAILFLVNEGGAYTGPYHNGKGESSSVDYYFTQYGSNYNFEICGLSADGSYDANTNFEFDLSGFTGQNWLYAAFYSGPSDRGIVFRNITWKNATTSTNNIITQSYDDDISNSVFINCIFQDNEVNYALVGNGAYNGVLQYKNCKFIRNNTYDTAHSMLSTYATVSSGRGNASTFVNCVFEQNQTSSTSSNYVYGAAGALVDFTNCLFYNNGYDTDSVCIYGYGTDEFTYFNINNCTFFNNTGTSVYVPNVRNLDTIYGYSNYMYKIYENIFVLNNKSIDMVNEPGLRFSYIGNNVFYNNTVEDIPNIIETLPGISGGNHVFDPEFTNGYSGDFSVPHDSRLFSYSTVPGVPIGGSFVQKKSFTTTTSGSLSFGSGEVGDTVTVSGKSYQKVNASPPVWRRFVTTPALTGIFSPSSLANLYGWYDASTDVVTSGTDVTQWTDKSGTDNHLSGTGYPTLTSAGLNGLDIINFSNGTSITSQSTSYNTSPWCSFIIMKPTDNTWVSPSSLTNNLFLLAADTGSSSPAQVTGTNPTYYLNGSLWVPSTRNVVRTTLNNSFNIVQINSVDLNTNFDTTQWTIGVFNGTSVYNFIGDIAEIVILDTVPTDAERRKIEGYLAHKWGLAGNLPSNHPFKNYAP